MKFYEMLSEHYDEIFPLNSNLQKMVTDLTPKDGGVLDVGCATGTLIRGLEAEGLNAVGLEYEPSLIGYPERTLVGDMHAIPFENEFDTLVCTGNTLAHAKDKDAVSAILREFYKALKPEGRVIIQILNYDLILANRPDRLPSIKTENVVFERHYQYLENSINFEGKLLSGGESASSNVALYPLTESEIRLCAVKNGFTFQNIYGGFDYSNYIFNRSFPMIIVFAKL